MKWKSHAQIVLHVEQFTCFEHMTVKDTVH